MIVCAQTYACLVLTLAGALEAVQPPPLETMPLHATNYWFFDGAGQPVAWNGQANGDPTAYANGYPTDPAHEWHVAGCISEWTKVWNGPDSYGFTTAVFFTWNGHPVELACYDEFGAETYRAPFYHERHGEWVIPVDVLTPDPVYGLVERWQVGSAIIGDLDMSEGF